MGAMENPEEKKQPEVICNVGAKQKAKRATTFSKTSLEKPPIEELKRTKSFRGESKNVGKEDILKKNRLSQNLFTSQISRRPVSRKETEIVTPIKLLTDSDSLSFRPKSGSFVAEDMSDSSISTSKNR